MSLQASLPLSIVLWMQILIDNLQFTTNGSKIIYNKNKLQNYNIRKQTNHSVRAICAKNLGLAVRLHNSSLGSSKLKNSSTIKILLAQNRLSCYLIVGDFNTDLYILLC